MIISQDDLSGDDIRCLLKSHLEDAYKNSPPDSVHALDITALKKPNITFWSVRDEGVLMGCGALKQLSKTHGEIKSMRTVNAHLGKGIGKLILGHLIDEARNAGYNRLSLETGNNELYAPARALYKKFEFIVCEPFADYEQGIFSVYMTLEL